ncbi:hypothetical protein EGW08_018182 [Elysia chlorotica]|uniref:Uncharacterized protein n=1 Tax=Elysia chlorotica TaxID=188477 RepID=A0A3S1H845_ELYCH|nr:hypothetical protein EGW08_018182 [Elysia chlorotica]
MRMSAKPVKYLRPLDRSQDKRFEKLAPKNQGSITALRTALERTKSRIAVLKDENTLKNEVIEEERILRKAAEDRLDNFLVDLYQNPDVNAELRHRLPYANKNDPKEKGQENETVEVEEVNTIVDGSMTPNRPVAVHESHQNERVDVLTNSTNHGLISPSDANLQSSTSSSGVQVDYAGKSQTGQVPVWLSQTTYNQVISPEAQLTNSWVSNTASRSGTIVSSAASLNAYDLTISTAAAPYMLPMGPLSSSSTHSTASFAALPQPKVHQQPASYTYSANPLASASFASLAPSSYINLPNTYDPKASEESNSQRSSTVHNQPGIMNNFAFESESLVEAPSSAHLASSPFGVNIQPLHINSFPYKTPSLYSQGILSDNVSHISRLLAEIATLKRENQEMKDKLKASEQKCEELRLHIGTPDDKKDQDLGALIEEIRAAEKVRDQTVKQVVQTAQEDKARAFKKMNNRSKEINVPKIVSDTELSDTEDDVSVTSSESSLASEHREVKTVADGGDDVSDDLSPPLSQQDLKAMMQRQRRIMSEELQRVIDERNEARQGIIKLENKLSAFELRPKSTGKVEELIATLGVVKRERDVAVAKLKTLMSEMEETKLVYSLHKALWRGDLQNETSSSERSTKFDNRDQAMTKNNTVSSYFSKHEDTKAKLEARLAFSNQERDIQSQRIKELEQLVKRQRKKLNAMCAGPMLMDGYIETE